MATQNALEWRLWSGPISPVKTTLWKRCFMPAARQPARHAQEGNTVGDSSPEARARQMSTEINVAAAKFLDDPWTILDCPGSGN